MTNSEPDSVAPKLRCLARQEDILNRRNIGILATAIGSALAAWYWSRHRSPRRSMYLTPAREQGDVIYDNTPVASAEGVI